MTNIFAQTKKAAEEYGYDNNYVAGANIAASRKIAKGMKSQGLI